MKIFDFLHKVFSNDLLSYAGVVRGSQAIFVFYVPESVFNSIESLKVYALSDSDEIHDIEVVEVVKSKGESVDGFFIHAKYPAENLLNISGVNFFINSHEAACADEKYSLNTLVHHSYENFQQSFSFAARRIIDEETARFVARNNMLYSKAASGTVKVTSFSIYVYKSISTGILDHSELEGFFEIAKSSVEFFSNEEASSRSIRSDVIGRALSIRLAYCHYLIAYGSLKEIKDCVLDLFSFSEVAKQPGGEKRKLEDHSYLYFKFLVMGMASSWLIKDYRFYELLKINAVQTYKYVSAISSDLPYVYLKEYGETYSSYLALVNFLREGEHSKEIFFEVFNSASRVKGKSYIDHVRRRFLESGDRLLLYKKINKLTASKAWFDLTLPRGKFCVSVHVGSGEASHKAAIVGFNNSVFDVRIKSKSFRGLVSSDYSSVGMYKYIPLFKEKRDIYFEFEVFCDECIDRVTFFKWDSSLQDLSDVLFCIHEL